MKNSQIVQKVFTFRQNMIITHYAICKIKNMHNRANNFVKFQLFFISKYAAKINDFWQNSTRFRKYFPIV